MFIKRETMAGNAYAYRMSLNIKTSVTYDFFELYAVVKLFLLDIIIRFFATHP